MYHDPDDDGSGGDLDIRLAYANKVDDDGYGYDLEDRLDFEIDLDSFSRNRVDVIVDIADDPDDPQRCRVRFGMHGPTRSLGTRPERVRAFFDGETRLYDALPELSDDDLGFLEDGLWGWWNNDGEGDELDRVSVQNDAADPRRCHVRFGWLGIERTIHAPPPRVADFLQKSPDVPIDRAFPEVSEQEHAFLRDGLARVPGGRPNVDRGCRKLNDPYATDPWSDAECDATSENV